MIVYFFLMWFAIYLLLLRFVLRGAEHGKENRGVRVLTINDEAKNQIRRVVDYAVQPEHWYRQGHTSFVPGDDPHFVAHLDTYRCVFTITKFANGLIARQLSISVPSVDYPHPVAAFTIAQMFGFTGWDGHSFSPPPGGWMIDLNKHEHCVVMVQPYEEAKATA